MGAPQTRRTTEAHVQGMVKKREGHKPTLLGSGEVTSPQMSEDKAGQGRSKVLFAFESDGPGGIARPTESRVAKLGQTSVLETQKFTK